MVEKCHYQSFSLAEFDGAMKLAGRFVFVASSTCMSLLSLLFRCQAKKKIRKVKTESLFS